MAYTMDQHTYQINFDQNGESCLISSTSVFSAEALWQAGQILAEDTNPLYNVGSVYKADLEDVPDPNA